jgi:hypothetical protein
MRRSDAPGFALEEALERRRLWKVFLDELREVEMSDSMR